MRPFARSGISILLGIVSAVALVGGASLQLPAPAFLAPPTTLLAAGSSVTVPPYRVANDPALNASGLCQPPVRCGSPGEWSVPFTVGSHARLTGSLAATAPLEIWVGNSAGMENACGLSNPPPACAPAVGPAYLYTTPAAVTALDLGSIDFPFTSAGYVLPAGTWYLLLINDGSSPVSATATATVLVTPTW